MLRTPDSCLVSWCTLTSNRNPAPHLIQKVTATIPNSPPAGVEPFLRTQTRPACTKLTLKQCRTDIFKLTSWKTTPPPKKTNPQVFFVFIPQEWRALLLQCFPREEVSMSLHKGIQTKRQLCQSPHYVVNWGYLHFDVCPSPTPKTLNSGFIVGLVELQKTTLSIVWNL